MNGLEIQALAPILDVSHVQELERRIAEAGTSLLELMKRAGTALAEAAIEQTAPHDRVVILAGSGNNGGDGWVAAQKLSAADREVIVIAKSTAQDLTSEPARTAALDAVARKTFAVAISPTDDAVQVTLEGADLIIDAILGTGFTHDTVREPYAAWIHLANKAHEHGISVIAADCPSGLNAQSGIPATKCVYADKTITMLTYKPGLLADSARPYVGTLTLTPLIENVERSFDEA